MSGRDQGGNVSGLKLRNIAPVEHDAATGGAKEFGEQIEASRLSGAVRPDHGVNGAARDPQVDGAHSDKTGKIFCQVFGFEDRIARHQPPPTPSLSAYSAEA